MFGGAVSTAGPTSLGSTLFVGFHTILATVSVRQTLGVSGAVSALDATQLLGALTVAGASEIQNTLTVADATSLGSSLTVSDRQIAGPLQGFQYRDFRFKFVCIWSCHK